MTLLPNPRDRRRHQPHLASVAHIACIKEKPEGTEVKMQSVKVGHSIVNPHIASLDALLERCPGEFVVFPNKYRLRTAIRLGAIVEIIGCNWSSTKILYFVNGEMALAATEVMVSIEEVAKTLDPVFVAQEVEKDKKFIPGLVGSM
ncbi:hypothetical protein HDV00_000924 [Rhizophlyctis rosea]|nr:hypothetical protein HDV00_000924 [Rhizophlyctis rosea]